MALNTHRRLVLLGATGSIGRSAIDIVAQTPDLFSIEAVAGGSDVEGLARTARAVGAKFAAIRDENLYVSLKQALSGSGVEIGAGAQSIVEAALRPADIVVGAVAGAAGVLPTYAALQAGRTIALANKECLVCAGTPFMRKAAEVNATILPLDSEHDAIWQALGGAARPTSRKWSSRPPAARSAPGRRRPSPRPGRNRRSNTPIGRWAAR